LVAKNCGIVTLGVFGRFSIAAAVSAPSERPFAEFLPAGFTGEVVPIEEEEQLEEKVCRLAADPHPHRQLLITSCGTLEIVVSIEISEFEFTFLARAPKSTSTDFYEIRVGRLGLRIVRFSILL
jgi:hypothetical protein